MKKKNAIIFNCFLSIFAFLIEVLHTDRITDMFVNHIGTRARVVIT